MKRYFLTGLVILIPLAITIMATVFFINWITDPFMGFVSYFVRLIPIQSENTIRTISHIVALILLFLITLGIGLVAQKYFFQYLLKLGDRVLNQIPIANKIFKTTQEIFHSLLIGKKKSFQKVVLITFPREGCYVLGFVTHDAPETCREKTHEDLVSVFVPTAPNPMSGFIAMRPRSDLLDVEMSGEEAIKYIVSCGVAPPEKHQPPVQASGNL